MAVHRPLQKLELAHQHGPEPVTLFHLCRRESFAPPRPAFFSGRLENGHSPVSSPFNRFCNCSLDAGVKPLRVRAA